MKATALARNATLALGVLLGGSMLAQSAQALPILSFSQVGNKNTITGTEVGSKTTIATSDTAVTISQIDATLGTPLSAFLTIDLTSISAATKLGADIVQDYSGTFSITSKKAGKGVDYLSGSLIDVAFGANKAFTLSATTPPAGSVTFKSDVITDLSLDRGASLSFANVTPGLKIKDGTIASFKSSVSGTFSAEPASVPEPVSLTLLGTGLFGLGLVRRRRA